ncbi:class I SAM-dependent methyltransferase [Roseivirga pacifica]|uniref:class I SAM-dependent methyltransferase n=1 Tax=Roseivirga pacifica TaxID=1267423 RepID=UPI003BB1A284
MIKGIEGYSEAMEKFTSLTLSIDFELQHKDFLAYIPKEKCDVLDLGAGIGRDADYLSAMGHKVVAVEPNPEMVAVGQTLFKNKVEWISDSLPILKMLNSNYRFNFILASGVWHHINGEEQKQAIKRTAQLLDVDGIFAVSLRNGPAGLGKNIYPTDDKVILKAASANGLKLLLHKENQPSLIANKADVRWTRLVFQKPNL